MPFRVHVVFNADILIKEIVDNYIDKYLLEIGIIKNTYSVQLFESHEASLKVTVYKKLQSKIPGSHITLRVI